MEPGLLATTKEFISGYWPHVSGGAVAVAATVGTANFAYIRRPKSSPTEAGPYFTEAALLSPPLTRPAYSDRMAYVLAEMSDLAYYPFEGQRGFVDDAAENAKSLDLTDDTNVREFLETFSTELMSGRRLQLGSMKKVLSNSGFALLDVIDINETQGFACKRIAENEPPLPGASLPRYGEKALRLADGRTLRSLPQDPGVSHRQLQRHRPEGFCWRGNDGVGTARPGYLVVDHVRVACFGRGRQA